MSEIPNPVRDTAKSQLERFAHKMGFPVTESGTSDLLDAFERVCKTPAQVIDLCNRLVDAEKAPTVADVRRVGSSAKCWEPNYDHACPHCKGTGFRQVWLEVLYTPNPGGGEPKRETREIPHKPMKPRQMIPDEVAEYMHMHPYEHGRRQYTEAVKICACSEGQAT